MGRRVPNQGDANDAETEVADVPAPQLEGGSYGIENAKATVGGALVEPSSKVFEPPKVAKFMVLADHRINVGTNITYLRRGQLVDELNYDIDMLKRHGVPLQPFEETKEPKAE